MKSKHIKLLILIFIIAAVDLIILNPLRERYNLPFGAEDVDFVTMYCEDDVKYKKLTEQRDIQKIISILTSQKIYEHDPEPPEEAGVLNMKFEMRLTDGTIEMIDLVESGFGYLTDQRRKLKVSYLEPATVWSKFSDEITFIKNYIEYPVYDSESDLVRSADLIFQGTVTNVEYKMMDAKTGQPPADESDMNELEKIPYAYTIYTVKADRVYKGNLDSKQIAIAYPGGTFGDTAYVVRQLADTEEEERETPEISEGKEYIFLTRKEETFYPELLNPIQSVYSKDDAKAEEILKLAVR